MKKLLLPFFAVLVTSAAFGQPILSKIMVVNSGEFEFASPYNDYVSVGAIDPMSNTYSVIDTIYNQSAGNTLIQGDVMYVVSEDSIVQYDLLAMQRMGAASFDSISGYSGFYSALSVAANNDFLFIGNWYGATNNNVQVYSTFDMSYVGAIDGITMGVNSMAIIGDSLYIAQNQTGASWQDTLGTIAVVDIISQLHIRDIDPGANGTDIANLTTDGSKLYTFNTQFNAVTTYDPVTGIITNQPFNGTLGFGPSGSQLTVANGEAFMPANGGIASYNFNTGTVTDHVSAGYLMPAFAYDFIGGNFYGTNTDYSSFGKVYTHDSNGNIVDSVDVGVSPENIALHYLFGFSIGEETEPETLAIWPNPGREAFRLQLPEENGILVISDIAGKQMYIEQVNATVARIDATDWPKGMYLIRYEKEGKVNTSRWIKQ